MKFSLVQAQKLFLHLPTIVEKSLKTYTKRARLHDEKFNVLTFGNLIFLHALELQIRMKRMDARVKESINTPESMCVNRYLPSMNYFEPKNIFTKL